MHIHKMTITVENARSQIGIISARSACYHNYVGTGHGIRGFYSNLLIYTTYLHFNVKYIQIFLFSTFAIILRPIFQIMCQGQGHLKVRNLEHNGKLS